MHRRNKTTITTILVVMMQVFLAFCCFPCWSAQAQGPQGAEGSQFNTSEERIGGLRLGLAEKELARTIPCAPRKGKELLEEATGDYVQTWRYADCGIVLKMGSERKGGSKVIQSITVTSPSDLVTSRGIRIGSTASEVIKVYGQYRDQDSGTDDGKQFVAGSVYDGMIFDFKGGRVFKMFLGAAAE
jgi:hypothetical protein